MAGIYQADIYCDDCIECIKERLWRESPDGADFETREEWEDSHGFDDERGYDSDEYPKYCGDDEESDSPQHCGSHDDCVNAHVCNDGTKIGYFFGNELTSDGYDYVEETVREDVKSGRTDSVACEVWAPAYGFTDLLDPEADDDCDDYTGGGFIVGEKVHFDGCDDIGTIADIGEDFVLVECNGKTVARDFDEVYPLSDLD